MDSRFARLPLRSHRRTRRRASRIWIVTTVAARYGEGVITFSHLNYASLRNVMMSLQSLELKSGDRNLRLPARSEATTLGSHLDWNSRWPIESSPTNTSIDQPAERRQKQLAISRRNMARDAGRDIVHRQRAARHVADEMRARSLIVRTTLAPTMPPKVQYLDVRSVMTPADEPPRRRTCMRKGRGARASARSRRPSRPATDGASGETPTVRARCTLPRTPRCRSSRRCSTPVAVRPRLSLLVSVTLTAYSDPSGRREDPVWAVESSGIDLFRTPEIVGSFDNCGSEESERVGARQRLAWCAPACTAGSSFAVSVI